MKKTNTVLLTLIFLASLAPAYSYQQAPTYQGQASYIMAGTPLNVSMDTTLGTEFSNVGDKFSATLSSPVYAGSQLIAPPGSKVEGFVTEVTPAGRGGKPGSMDLKITNVVTPNGQRVPLSASVNKTNFKLQADGGRVSNYAKATTAGAAGGALSGLIGGAISGGKFGKSTAIGTGIGAGVGILGGTIKKGQELIIRQGMSIPFVVESSTQAGYSPAPTPVQHYGGDFGAPTGGYQPVPQQPSGGFADPYSQQSNPSNYQNQNPYNPYLD